ncbi:MAG TPA: ATP-binding protein [Candidatus Caenarcaniphilales bacterium]|nr:ATP-binding protein [Candidatus Caenarcaniphilales bacterium]
MTSETSPANTTLSEQPVAESVDDRSGVEQILAQQAAVATIGQRALSETRFDRLLAEAAALVAEVLGTELVSVMELAPDGHSLRLIAGIGWREGLVGELSLGTDASMAGYTVATGGPVIVEDLWQEMPFAVSEVLREHDAVSGMGVRIGDDKEPFGALLTFTNRRGHFTQDDANFLQAVANVLAGAAARLRAEAELRRSRDELAAIVGGVTDGITVQARDGALVFANDAAARLTGYGSAEEMMAAPLDDLIRGFELLQPDGQPMPVDQLPGRRALAGESVPETLVRFRVSRTGDERWSAVRAVPVRADDGTVVQVINVFRDVTTQKRAEDGRRFLADALGAMASTLDSAEAARRLDQACVPALADYCLVDLVEPDGSLHSAAVAHVDPELTAKAQRERDSISLHVSDATGPGRVVREGTTELNGEGAGALVRRLGAQRQLSVPLVARERPIGALTLLFADAARTFDEDAVQIVEELVIRAGPAIENARLYEAVDDRRAELDAVLSAMAEAVLVFDQRGRLRLSNRAALRLFGGVVPQTTEELGEVLIPVDGDDRSLVVGEVSPLGADVNLRGAGRSLELRRYRSPRTAADRSEKDAPSVVVLRDVTDARAARAARDAFIGLLSHELRTPITTIYGGSRLLERGMDEERRAEVVSDIRAESERLARLIEDLLVMTRVERGGVEIGDEPVLVQRLLPPLVDALVARWPGLRIDLELGESLPAVKGDVTYLEQVLRNLLTNAVRYGEALESGLTVAAAESDGEVIVRVLDRGPGMGEEAPEQLFELFYRAASARGVPGGAGIGLFVCRQLVQAMGGRIWARPRPEGGAEFGFALPVIEADIG